MKKWGLLFQAFTWKREAYEAGEPSAGYGIGFNQLESTRATSYGVIQQNFSTSRLCEDIFNDIMSKLRTKDLEECTRLFSRIFSHLPKKSKIQERLAELAKKPVDKRKKGLIQLYVSMVNEALSSMFKHETSDLLTIPTYFLNIGRYFHFALLFTNDDIVKIDWKTLDRKFTFPVATILSTSPSYRLDLTNTRTKKQS